MTVIHQWTLKLAEAVTPNEVYLAPSIADNYIAKLHAHTSDSDTAQTRSQAVDSTCEPCNMHLLLPLVIHSVENASHGLIDILSSSTTHEVIFNVMPLATMLISFKECSLREKSHKQVQHAMSSFVSIEGLEQKISNEYPGCKAIIDTMSETLSEDGIPETVAEVTAWKTFQQFLENRKSGLEYLRKLKR